MKLYFAVMLASVFAVGLTPAIAGTQEGTIQSLYVRDSDGLIFLALEGAPTGRPACAIGTAYWMIANETTETGKRLFATLLAAQLSGRQVHIDGKNTCTRWGDGEDIETVGVLK